MTEQQRLDFLSAFGQEFCEAIAAAVGWDAVTPQDAFEVFLRVFGCEPTPQLLADMSGSKREQLRVGANQYFESDDISLAQIELAVSRTLARYPASEGQEK